MLDCTNGSCSGWNFCDPYCTADQVVHNALPAHRCTAYIAVLHECSQQAVCTLRMVVALCGLDGSIDVNPDWSSPGKAGMHLNTA